MKALALFSGGLDSLLACKVIQAQGIDVIALNFVSYFFGANESYKHIADKNNIPLEFVDFKEAHRLMIQHPQHGYGSA